MSLPSYPPLKDQNRKQDYKLTDSSTQVLALLPRDQPSLVHPDVYVEIQQLQQPA